MIFAAVGGGMIIACGAFVWYILKHCGSATASREKKRKTEVMIEIYHDKGQPEAVSGWPLFVYFLAQRTIAFVHSQSHQSRSYLA